MNDEQKKAEVTEEMVTKADYLRLAADFENFRKEQERLQGELTQFASLMVVTKMLDVLDLLDEAVVQAPQEVTGQKEWFTGLEQVQRQFARTIVDAGAERIEVEGKEFDPVTMEAVGTAPGGEGGTVQLQQRAGWTMHGRVIRPARVTVYQ